MAHILITLNNGKQIELGGPIGNENNLFYAFCEFDYLEHLEEENIFAVDPPEDYDEHNYAVKSVVFKCVDAESEISHFQEYVEAWMNDDEKDAEERIHNILHAAKNGTEGDTIVDDFIYNERHFEILQTYGQEIGLIHAKIAEHSSGTGYYDEMFKNFSPSSLTPTAFDYVLKEFLNELEVDLE